MRSKMPLRNPTLQALTRCLFLCSARVFLEYIIHTLATLHRQHQVIKISSSTLDLHVLAITDAFKGIVAKATNDLGRQATPSRCLRASTQTSLARWRYRGRWLKHESVTVSSIASIFVPVTPVTTNRIQDRIFRPRAWFHHLASTTGRQDHSRVTTTQPIRHTTPTRVPTTQHHKTSPEHSRTRVTSLSVPLAQTRAAALAFLKSR